MSAILGIYDAAGGVIVANAAGVTNLAYTIPTGGAGNYYARVTAAVGTAGLFAQYILNIDLSDNRPTAVASVSLPPDGGTATAYAWLVWMHGQTRRPPFWIPPDCEERLTRADDAARFTTHPVTPRPASDGLDLPEYLRRTPPRPRS